MPIDVPIVDTMIGFKHTDVRASYDAMRPLFKDKESNEFDFPVEYMFKDVPDGTDPISNAVDETRQEMDKYGIAIGMVSIGDEDGQRAVTKYPDRFVATMSASGHTGTSGVEAIVRAYEKYGLRSVNTMPSGCIPPLQVNDAKWYPTYAKCAELGIPIFVCMGVPGPRVPAAPQNVELVEEVCWYFPELTIVLRHGCEPWEDLAVKLMLKWPNLYYSTSAFAPRYYPQAIVDYANTRGADKVIYAGYYPFGLSLERIFRELPGVPFRDHVWPKFLSENARRVLRLDERG
jgi:hypothetical protein